MRILVTGAGGMLGHDLVEAAQAASVDLTAFTHAELDVVDAGQVERALTAARPDVLVNCAAWTDVDGAESAPDGAHRVNADGARHLARVARRAGVWIIHISTDYVFDGSKRSPYIESDPTAPASAYGRSKLAGEQAVAQAAPEHHTIVRSSWLFGAHGRCFPATILRLAAERDELTVVDDQVGCPTFTAHLAHALLTLCETRPLGVVHVAGEGSCTWYDFAREVVRSAGLSTRVLPGRTAAQHRPAPRPAYSVLGTERPADAPRLPHWRAGLTAYMAATQPTPPLGVSR
jgi:dTDP-4-dehydrorhamnose reductase